MIRFAIEKDIISIISLWNEAFGDKERDIRFFLDNKFVPKNTIVCEEQNKIISMLFLLEGNMVLNAVSYPSYYLYAACTAKSHRGKGIMAKLLEKAKETACERNKYFICLMPAEDSLFDFYKKFGYKSVFSRKILYIDKCELKDINIEVDQSETIDPGIIRKNVFHDFDRFEWDEKAVDFACKHHSLYGGNVLATRKGYALYVKSDNKAIVKEFAFQPSYLKFISAQIVYESNSDILIINLPADYPTEIGKYEIKKSAMALAVKDEYCRYINGIENLYLGLTLD